MSYIKRFVENNNVINTEYGNLKYEVNQDDKTILMDSATRQVLKDILVFDRSDFSRLDENVYVLFYDDKNKYEIFDILSYQPNRKWKYNEGGMIARTILQQLGGASRLKAMTGAYNFIDTGKGLSFRIKNAKANYIKITLNSLDLYNLEIGRIRGVDYKVVAEQNNIYADQLKGIIERVTGMYLSLAKGGEIEKSNNEMLQSQLKAVEHHAKELSNIVTNKTPIEAWVVGKIERAATDLSDITHYLDGAKFERGGEVMAKGLEWEDNLYLTHPILNQFLDDSELYYGFTNNEMIEFIKKLNSLGYDCDVYSKNTDIIFNPNKKQKKGTTDLYVGFQPINIRLKKMADGGKILKMKDYNHILELEAVPRKYTRGNDLKITDKTDLGDGYAKVNSSFKMSDNYTRHTKDFINKNFADGGLIGKKVKVGFRKEVGIVKDYDDDFVTVYYPDLGFTEKVNLKMEDVTIVEMAMGGKVTFNDKVKAIEKSLVGKKVPNKFKRQYGQKYNETEAHEAATKIAGSIVKK